MLNCTQCRKTISKNSHKRALLNGQPTISGVTLHNRWKCCKVAISIYKGNQRFPVPDFPIFQLISGLILGPKIHHMFTPEPTFWMGNQRFLGLLCTIGENAAKSQLASIYKGNQRFLKLQFLYFIGMDWLWIEYQKWQFSLGIDNPGGNFYIWPKKICGKPLKTLKNTKKC